MAAEAMGVAVALVEDADAAPGPTVSQFIEECADLYRNTDEHPAVRAKALGIMAEYKLGGIAWVARKRAERELDQAEKSTDGEGPLVIARMPPKNPPPGEAIDVEVIDG